MWHEFLGVHFKNKSSLFLIFPFTLLGYSRDDKPWLLHAGYPVLVCIVCIHQSWSLRTRSLISSECVSCEVADMVLVLFPDNQQFIVVGDFSCIIFLGLDWSKPTFSYRHTEWLIRNNRCICDFSILLRLHLSGARFQTCSGRVNLTFCHPLTDLKIKQVEITDHRIRSRGFFWTEGGMWERWPRHWSHV